MITITDLDDPALRPYAYLTEAQLRTGSGLFIAESPKVINVALDAGYRPESLLCEQRHITGDAAGIIARCPGLPVYTGSRRLLSALTGYTLTRGVLCAMHRPEPRTISDVCSPAARRLVVIDGVCDTTNVGAIFRTAAALGIDGILLTPTACDPLNRRVIRVSMGTALLIPWARLDGAITPTLHTLGYKTAAMALRHDTIMLDNPCLDAEPRLALILGTEGDGLADEVITSADYTIRIPMHRHIDSLNVAAAAAIAIYRLTRR